MAATILLTTFDCRDAVTIARFWASALGYEIRGEGSNPPGEIELCDPAGTGHPLYFVNPPGFNDPYEWTVLQDPEGNEFCVGHALTPV